tara:strand:- start:2296 stop:3627 length:1332 start_codon:yes stop_codon:yes gene_type:complete
MAKLKKIMNFVDVHAPPRGVNGQGSLASFYQRTLYKEYKYPTAFPAPLDMWYDKLLFGRVDQTQHSIIPQTLHLKTIKTTANPNIMCLNVVQTAFEKLVIHMSHAYLTGNVRRQGNPYLLEMKAYKGYESADASYAFYTQSLYKNFMASLTARENTEIKDFRSFLEHYRRYLLNVAPHSPITKTNYVISNNCSRFAGGLSIAIASEPDDADYVKYRRFILDANFEFYRKCAKKYGFLVDKNAPWVLTADLFSTAFFQVATHNYYTQDGDPITEDNFFDIFYRRTCWGDFEGLINILVNSYQSMLKIKPYYDSIPDAIGCPVVAKPRTPFTVNALDIVKEIVPDNVLPHKFLIDLYIDLRHAELKSPWSLDTINSFKTSAYELYRSLPVSRQTHLQNVAFFVDEIFLQFMYGQGGINLQIKSYKDKIANALDKRALGATIRSAY